MMKIIEKENLFKVLKSSKKKVIVVNSPKKAILLHVTLTRYFKKVANTDIITYNNLPEYLAKVEILKRSKFSSVLYRGALHVFKEDAYFASYRDKPRLFEQLGNVVNEILLCGVSNGLLKQLENTKKWSDIIKLIHRIKDICHETPDVIYDIALNEASIQGKIIYLFEPGILIYSIKQLIDKIQAFNETYKLPVPLIGAKSKKINKLADYLKNGGGSKNGECSGNEIEFLAFPQPEDEIRTVLNKIVSKGTAGDSAIGIADYKSSILKLKRIADEAEIKVIYGNGLPLQAFSSVRLFLSFMRLCKNEKSCQPLRDIITSDSLNRADNIDRAKCRNIISEHKKNRDLKSFADYLKTKDETFTFLKTLSEETAEYFFEINKSKNGIFSAEPMLNIIDRFIKTNEEPAALEKLKNIIRELENDYFFLNDPASVEEKIVEKIMDTMIPGKVPDGESLYVSSIQGLSGGMFSYVAFIGMDERSFSTKIPTDPVFLYTERDRINELAGSPFVLDIEMYLKQKRKEFLDIFDTYSKKVIFSWTANEAITGKRLMPSPYLFEIYRALNGNPGNIEDLEEYASLDRTFMGQPYLLRENYIYQDENTAGRTLGLFKNLGNYKKAYEDENSGYSGRIETDNFSKYIEEMEFSPSVISKIIKCPYSFLLEKIFRLEKEDFTESEPFTWIDHMEWGSIIHDILCAFYRLYKDNLPETPDELIKTGIEKLKSFNEEKPAPSNSIYESTKNRLVRELQHFFSHGLIFQKGFLPSYFEVPVGLPKDEAEELRSDEVVTADFGGHSVKLRGRIDRIDTDKKGNFILIDYKTGKYRLKDKTKTDVQHALYPILLRKAFKDRLNINSISAGYYYCTSRGEFERLYFKDEENKIREDFENLAYGLFEIIKAGNFPLNKNSCEYCDFENVCFVKNIRKITKVAEFSYYYKLIKEYKK